MGAPGTNIQVWQDWSDDDAEVEKKFGEKGASAYLKFPDNGKLQVRFVPPPTSSGLKTPFVKVYQHYIEFIPKDQAATAKFNCPKKMANKRCPACDRKQKLLDDGLAFDNPKVSMFAPKKRVYGAVLNRADEENPQILEYAFGVKVFKQLMSLREDYGNFVHPVSGHDVRIKKTGKTINDTEYFVTIVAEKTPLLEDAKALAALADSYPDLKQYMNVPTYDECVNAIKEAMASARGDNDAEEKPRRQGGGKPKPSNDSGWGDDDEVPRSGGGKKAKPKSDDDSWGDDSGTIDTTGETVGDAPFDDDEDGIPF